MVQLTIEAFDPRIIPRHSRWCFVGGSNRGKSHGMMSILSHLSPDIHFCLVFCPTESARMQYRKMVPASHIYSELDLDVLANLLSHLRAMKDRGKSRNCLCIFDDTSYHKQVWKSPVIRDLLFNSRHLSLTMMCTCQYCLDLTPDCRSQISCWVATSDPCMANRKRLFNCVFGGGGFRRFEDFDKVFQATTQDYSLCVFDATNVKVQSPSDAIFYYKAPAKIQRFKLGLDVFYKLEQKRNQEINASTGKPPTITVPT
jgi:hypothetical protein